MNKRDSTVSNMCRGSAERRSIHRAMAKRAEARGYDPRYAYMATRGYASRSWGR